MSPGRVSIREVATLAGVSLGTVSNVLNRPELVAPPTRERVESAIATLGFVRNESARQLRTARSRTVGLVVLDIANPFFTDLARGGEDAANEAGIAVILCNSDGDRAKERHYLTLLAEQRALGVLLVPVEGAPRRPQALRQQGIPVVAVDAQISQTLGCSVSVDDERGGEVAVEHLIERGHRRIAFVGGDNREHQVADRLRGAQKAVTATGGAVGLEVVGTSSLSVAGGRQAGRALLALPPRSRPSAAFCANDLLALGLLQELTRAGTRVPTDMAVVGYDDIDLAEAGAVPLSSVRQPRYQLGYQATQLLLEETTDERHRHRKVVFEPELVERESSRTRTPPRRRAKLAVPLPHQPALASAGGG